MGVPATDNLEVTPCLEDDSQMERSKDQPRSTKPAGWHTWGYANDPVLRTDQPAAECRWVARWKRPNPKVDQIIAIFGRRVVLPQRPCTQQKSAAPEPHVRAASL